MNKSAQTEERIKAVSALARRDDPNATRELLKALSDKSHYVAQLAAEALVDRATYETAPQLIDCFMHMCEDGTARDPGCTVRSAIALALARIEYAPAEDALVIGIRTIQPENVGGIPYDMAAQLRATCALSLAEIRAPSALLEISALLFDEGANRLGWPPRLPEINSDVRVAAARALGRLGSAQAMIPLTIKLRFPGDEKPETLAECMESATILGGAAAIELIEPYLNIADELLAAQAAIRIAATQDPRAAALLVDAAASMTGNALKAVILAISTLRSDDAQALLLGLAEHDREAVRLAVIEAISSRDDEAAKAALAKLAEKDASPRVKAAAVRALADMADG